ncbi:MAG TPA: hypothetical protein VJZ71_13610 [Phycisphaerae bacterium]|nr:hypothetical protein [Phycisphaerae bacterium]
MSALQRQVAAAQRRLWLIRSLRLWGWTLFGAAAAWTALLICDRLFALQAPLRLSALIALGASMAAAVLWMTLTRERELAAAVALDAAAGLKERTSTGLHAEARADDPFARAVIADAERSVTGISAAKVLPLRWTRSLSWSIAMVVVAVVSLALPQFDLLKRDEAKAAAAARQAAVDQIRSVVAKPVSAIAQVAEKNPDLAVADQIKALEDAMRTDAVKDPDVLRREAVKQLDRLQDALKDKANSERFKALDETKKRFKQIGESSDPKNELGKLMEQMSAGNFEGAQKELKQLQEKLAKRSHDNPADAKKAEEIQKQLNDLAKKMEAAAQDQQSAREMKNAGMSEKDVQRVLDALAKKDTKQLEKLAQELAERMKDRGVTQEQIKQMMEKAAQRQQACKQMQQMANKMGNACKQMQQGNQQAAQDELNEAGEQLSEMEQMEQSLNELEGQMASLDEARDGLNEGNQNQGEGQCQGDGENGPCKGCNGSGFKKDGSPCRHCEGTGRNKSGGGRGAGPRDRDDNVDVDFENKKARVKTAKGGSIVGQQFVKGDQLKGKSEVEFIDAAHAAEIDATDSLNRDRIPRAYRKGVRNYFDRLGETVKTETTDGGKSSTGSESKKPAAPTGGQ